MLEVQNIEKSYKTSAMNQHVLKGISLKFRESEFVSILGQSGSGKSTFLNIIGGLDRYDSGDLIIDGVSTKKYTDRDWDAFRAHTIGFIFQSYNLIMHQTLLSNVELSMTISGVSKSERKKRAKEALEKVGLGEHIHKKPNQLSGGQMQRVSIARALVNNPSIILADEPTGALDSATSVQIMELLKEVSRDKLVIMVTHNNELAEQYSTRIVTLKDGLIEGDTNPFTDPAAADNKEDNKKDNKEDIKNADNAAAQNADGAAASIPDKENSNARNTDQSTNKDPDSNNKNSDKTKQKHTSMKFSTCLGLSLQNLVSKKGRTIVTALASSIGIIGIALILSMTNGVQDSITKMQRETMAAYPITITGMSMSLGDSSTSVSSITEALQEVPPTDAVYADTSAMEAEDDLSSFINENNLKAFKEYLDDPDSEVHQYVTDDQIRMSYDIDYNVLQKEGDSYVPLATSKDSSDDVYGISSILAGMSGADTGSENFSVMFPGKEASELINSSITEGYDVLAGSWPQTYDEMVLVLDSNNQLPIDTLLHLGVISEQEYQEAQEAVNAGETPSIKVDYDQFIGREYVICPEALFYDLSENGTYYRLSDSSYTDETLPEGAIHTTITAVIKSNGGGSDSLNAGIAYTDQLDRMLIDLTNESPVIQAQLADPEVDVLTGKRFDGSDAKQEEDEFDIRTAIAEGVNAVDDEILAPLYDMIAEYAGGTSILGTFFGDFPSLASASTDAQKGRAVKDFVSAAVNSRFLYNLVGSYLGLEPIEDSSYDNNMTSFGYVDTTEPTTINIYCNDYEEKQKVQECIDHYNDNVEEENKIYYTDIMQVLTGTLSKIINVISAVLIALAAISLLVSCIMIGIITHISVMERTREIGILRALGASKRNIRQVFKAETFLIGLFSGILGVVIGSLITVPMNAVVAQMVSDESLHFGLHPGDMIILILISTLVTMLGGASPARKAAKKDPVTALRTE